MKTNIWPEPRIYGGRKPLIVRQGVFLLFAVYVALLAGRFSLARLSSETTEAFAIDLRWVLLISIILLLFAWYAGLVKSSTKRGRLVGIVPFGLWCAWLFLSILWSPRGADIQSGSIDILFLFSFGAIAWLVMAYLDNDSLEHIWTWVLVTGLLYFVLAIISGPDAQGRFAAPGGGPNTFVRIMVLSAIAALYLVTARSKRWPIATVPIYIVGAILSGSRGGILSAAIICLLFFIPLIRSIGIRAMLLLTGFGLFAAYLASLWRDGYVFSVIRERYIEQTLVEGYSSGRNIIIEQAWDMFHQNPIIGVGLNGFDVLESGPAEYGYAHNLFFSTLAESGLIGAVLLVTSLACLIFLSIRKVPTGGTIYALMAGLFFLSTSMFSGDYYDSRFVWFFLAMAALSASHQHTRQTGTPIPTP